MQWRHGDLLIEAVDAIPEGAQQRKGAPVLAEGEITGHSHRVAEPDAAEIWTAAGVLYLRILTESATLVHEEHAPITLKQGTYRFWQQREYTPQQIRRVVD